MSLRLLAEHHLEFLSLRGGCTGASESTHVKMPHFWKSHVTAHLLSVILHFSANVPENSNINHKVITVSATDLDDPASPSKYGEVRYSIISKLVIQTRR